MTRQPQSMFQITGSVLALPGIHAALGRAIYQTHLATAQAKMTKRGIPAWDDLAEDMADYVIEQAMSAATTVDAYRTDCQRKRPPREPGRVQDNPKLIEHMARAIYRTHGVNVPSWTEVTEELREWNRQYAMSVARVIDDAIAQHGKD
jgi:hypothetical protein